MEYEITTVTPITEEGALESVAAMGFHGFAIDDIQDQDETLHWPRVRCRDLGDFWHWWIADEHGKVTELHPGCRLQAPAGFLHRTLAGTNVRLVVGTNLRVALRVALHVSMLFVWLN